MARGDQRSDRVPATIAAVASALAGELVAAGAQAVVLMGSYARGEPRRHSDLDIVAVGQGPGYRLEVRDDLLVSISWVQPEEIEAAFASPDRAGYAVGGWRDAVILRDGHGVAARIIERARRWSWDELDPSAVDRYVASEICGLAEEVHKLVNLWLAGNRAGAAIQRNLLATRLAMVLAVHLRLVYPSENTLWDLVAAQLGPDWTAAQATALGLNGEDFRTTCAAALELYRLAAEIARPLFDATELAVVERAIAVAGELREEGTQ